MNPTIGLGKNLRRAMAKQDRDLSRVIGWLAGIVAAAVALSLPSVYFAIAYKSADAALRAEAEAGSRALNQIVNAAPDIWEYQTIRIMGILEQRLEQHTEDSRRVLGLDGNLIAATAGHPLPPVLLRSHPILDSGRPVGRIEIRRSLRPLAWKTLLFALLGGILGVAVFFVLKILPMAALRKALGELAREKERAQVTLRSIADGVITTGADGKVELMNRPAEEMTGWTQGEGSGRPIREVFRVLDGRLEARDGTLRRIDDSMAPIPDERRGSAGAVHVFRDVTEKVRREEELIKWQKLESLGNLAGGIAHEFNNIVAGILGNISLGKRTLDPKSGAYARLEEAEKASAMASELATKLLIFSKGGKPVRELISLEEAVRDSARLAVHGSRVRCAFEIGKNLWAAYADSGQIRQAVSNLVVNGVQATPGVGLIRIRAVNVTIGEGEIPYVKPGRYVRIEVADTGVGIPKENLNRVLDPYFTTEEKRTGLGLTTAYHIVKSHGGNLFVESEPGAGTTVSLLLPASMERPARAAGTSGQGPQNGRLRVLVMDDEDLVREMALGMLEHLGYDGRGARDGSEAIRMYAEAANDGRPFDLVFMDLTVPGGMGGKEASGKLLEMYPDARLIVSSGYSADPVMANYTAFGFRGILPKPYKVEEMGRVIRGVMAAPSKNAAGGRSGR